MSQPTKRQCRRIDKAVAELDTILTTPGSNGRNYQKIYSVLQFIFKEYCQTVENLKLLCGTDFKDYFLIIISFGDIPSEIANLLLSMLYNASKEPEFFDDLVTSSIFDTVTKIFLKNPCNYYRSLRFLSLCFSKNKTSFTFPLNYFTDIMSHCITKSNLGASKTQEKVYKELVIFLISYIKKQLSSDWSTFLEENDVSIIINTLKEYFVQPLTLSPKQVFEIAKLSMGVIKHNDTPIDVQNSFKEIISDVIKWFCSEGSSTSKEYLLDLYHSKTLHFVCYLAEEARNSVFINMLFHPNIPANRHKTLIIYLNLCQQGSYRTALVNSEFCRNLITLMNKCIEADVLNLESSDVLDKLRICSTVTSIFFIFNSGEKLILLAAKEGLFSSLLSLANYIVKASICSPQIFAECQSLLSKTFILMQRTTDYKSLNKNHCYTFVTILKQFKSLNCLNYLLYISFTAQFSQLVSISFISIIYHGLDCSSLSAKDQYFDNKPLRSTPSSVKKINSLPDCGRLILSNVLNSLAMYSSFSLQELSEMLLLLRKEALARKVLECKVVDKVLENDKGDGEIFPTLLHNLSCLIRWLYAVTDIKSIPSNDNCDRSETSADPITITNGQISFSISKNILVRSSPVFKNMFLHGFMEDRDSCIKFPYLSDDTLLCLEDILTTNSEKFVNFSHFPHISQHCYPWSIAFDLTLFSIMYELDEVFRITSSSLIKQSQIFKDEAFPPLGLKFIFIRIFNEIAKPLLCNFCQL